MGDFPLELVIPLSADAIADISMAAGGDFVITGRMASYDPAPGAADEVIFSLSDLVDLGGMETSLPKPFLTIVTASVPEPGSLAVITLIVGITVINRRR